MHGKWAAVVLELAGLAVGCVAARGAAPERWVEARSAHFIVLSDAGGKDAARLASHFERMRQVFGTLLPAVEDAGAGPVRVVAVKDRAAMQQIEPAAYLAAGQIDLAGFFLHSADKDYILVRVDAEQAHDYAVVYHEYTHALLRKASGWMPLWLNEGLAQFYGNTEFEDNAVWLGESNPAQLDILKRSELMPLAALLRVNAASPDYREEAQGSIFYAESWALTHMLTMSDRLQGTHRIRDYTERMALGEDSATAAENAFGDLDKLQKALEEYVAQRKFLYFTMPEPAGMEKDGIVLRPVTGAEADTVRGDVMAHTGRAEEAKALLDRVLAADPASGLAQEAMGYLRYQAGDFAGARQWYGKALEADPLNYRAQTYLAAATMRAGDKSDDAGIEAHLREALNLHPEFAPAYDALAMFDARRHRNLEEAETAARQAVELEPGELSFRVDCAEVMTVNGKFGDAQGMLRQAMPLARSPQETAAVQDRMARVERSETTASGTARAHGAGGYGQ